MIVFDRYDADPGNLGFVDASVVQERQVVVPRLKDETEGVNDINSILSLLVAIELMEAGGRKDTYHREGLGRLEFDKSAANDFCANRTPRAIRFA